MNPDFFLNQDVVQDLVTKIHRKHDFHLRRSIDPLSLKTYLARSKMTQTCPSQKIITKRIHCYEFHL